VTDDGIYGLGEVPGSADTTAALESAAEVLIGQDPFQLNAIYRSLVERFGAGDAPHNFVAWEHRRILHIYSAIEVACLDIMGKATGRPVCDLLGGRVRDRVDFSATSSTSTRAQGRWGSGPILVHPVGLRPASAPPRPAGSSPRRRPCAASSASSPSS
jgi:glucarate dehydratase